MNVSAEMFERMAKRTFFLIAFAPVAEFPDTRKDFSIVPLPVFYENFYEKKRGRESGRQLFPSPLKFSGKEHHVVISTGFPLLAEA